MQPCLHIRASPVFQQARSSVPISVFHLTSYYDLVAVKCNSAHTKSSLDKMLWMKHSFSIHIWMHWGENEGEMQTGSGRDNYHYIHAKQMIRVCVLMF